MMINVTGNNLLNYEPQFLANEGSLFLASSIGEERIKNAS
jgi:hypothetical protein